MFKRAVALASAAGLTAAVFAVAPAHAAPLGEPPVPGPNNVIQQQFVTDAGGVEFGISVRWAYTYQDKAGNFRASLNPLRISTQDDSIEDAGIDYRFRVYSGRANGTFVKIQDVIVDGDEELDHQISRNPKNPLNYDGVSRIKISGVGVDGDGLAGAPSITFTQPVLGQDATP